MSKRSKSRHRSHRSQPSKGKVTCTALLVVDQTPFLQKALSTCKRLRKELHKKQALLAEFEEQDRSAFQQWLNSTHGTALTQIRELREEVAAYQFILHHLTHCAYYTFEDVPELYQELFKRKKEGTLYSYMPPQQEEEEAEEDWDDDEDWGDDEDWEDEDDDMREFFDRMFGGGSSKGDRSEEPRVGSARKVANDARLKTCYRNLAKRLHPDHSELEESIREKRWHEIQEAYHQGDLEGLLRVEAICDMDEAGLSVQLGLARLRDLAAYHKSHLIPIRNALRAAKQDIAFEFSKKGPSPTIKRAIAADLRNELLDLKEMMAEMARSAKQVRNEVAAQIRENEMRAARSARRSEQLNQSKQGKSKSPKGPTDSRKQASSSKASGPEQMSFF